MKQEMVSPLLLQKYNQPVPRYTSYPTVPFWKEMNAETWKDQFRLRFSEQNHINGLSLYLHLPFCESLCTYCGCNKKITTNHSVESVYLEAIKKEWKMYRSLMDQTPVIRELHIGGGTPTFFSPANLEKLLRFIFNSSIIHPRHEFSIEGHPNNTTAAHLKTLYNLGFRRISYGVQDNDPEVQRIINRIQPFENVQRATEAARKAGFTSVNFDLIYGLPGQTIESMERTFRQVVSLRPDRIAFYSYAHVPWTSKAQRLFTEADLPNPEEKIALFLKGKDLLIEAGYEAIGMDHFVLPDDALAVAKSEGRLHRNFMGYTTQATALLLGLGVSSISDAGTAYAQNERALHDYYRMIDKGVLPITKGYLLTEEDRVFRQYILDISCRGSVIFRKEDLPLLQSLVFPELKLLAEDGLVQFSRQGMQLTDEGRYFIRNVCHAFDIQLHRNSEATAKFSKAI